MKEIIGENKVSTLLDETTIIMGGAQKNKFVPNINMSKWGDDAWLNINHPDIVNNEKLSFISDKASITIGNNTHRMYELPNGNLEYEIELAARPVSNEIQYDLKFPDGLTFEYQDTLENDWARDSMGKTLAVFLNENARADNVVGSYAVFWAKQNRKYKTGKFCHIYRPKLIDASNNETFADINIDPVSKKMTITMDGTWLDNASYPVIIDPELGYSTKGATEYGSGTIYSMCIKATTDASGGDTSVIYGYVKNINGSTSKSWRLSMYDDSSGDPNNQLLAEVVLTEAASFDDVSSSAYVTTLSASTPYWICIMNEDSDAHFFYDTHMTINDDRYLDYASFDQPATYGTPTGGLDRYYSIWVDYTGGTIIPVATHVRNMMQNN